MQHLGTLLPIKRDELKAKIDANYLLASKLFVSSNFLRTYGGRRKENKNNWLRVQLSELQSKYCIEKFFKMI